MARRFIDIYAVSSRYASSASADAREVGELLLRAYAQAETRRPAPRRSTSSTTC